MHEESTLNARYRVVVAIALAAFAARFAWEVLRAIDVFADYHAYYRAAANLRAGADLYAEGKLLVARNDYNFWTQTDGQYVYPPAFAIALLPLTIVDIGKGSAVWLLILVLATLAAPWLVARLLGRPVGWFSYLCLALPLWAFLPLALGVRFGLIATAPVALTALLLIPYVPIALSVALCLVAGRPFSIPGLGNVSSYQPPARRFSPDEETRDTRPWDLARALPIAPLALPLLAALVLAVGWRDRRIDDYLLLLAVPGLLGTTILPWLPLVIPKQSTVRRTDLADLAPLLLPALGATPLLLGLRFGQPDVLLLLLMALALLAHLRRRNLLAGVALGLAAAVKPTLALYGLYYLKKRAWGTLGAAALTGTLVGLGPFLFLGRAAFADWLAISRYFGGGDYLAYPNNQSLRGLLLRAFVGGPGHEPLLVSPPLGAILWLLGAAAALGLWWWCVIPERQETPRAVAEYGLTIALVLFASPLAEDIHYAALILPLGLLADQLLRGTQPTSWRILALGALLAFLLPLPALFARVGEGTLPRLLASAPYLYGLLLVAASLALWLRAGQRQETAA